jgi:hypothetical protein
VLSVYASLLCKLFGLMKFAFGLKPKFHIPPERLAIFFPNFTRALSDAFFLGLASAAARRMRSSAICPYPSGRFPVADPSREVAVFPGLGQQAADELRSIHLHSPSKISDGIATLLTRLTWLPGPQRVLPDGGSPRYGVKAASVACEQCLAGKN